MFFKLLGELKVIWGWVKNVIVGRWGLMYEWLRVLIEEVKYEFSFIL